MDLEGGEMYMDRLEQEGVKERFNGINLVSAAIPSPGIAEHQGGNEVLPATL